MGDPFMAITSRPTSSERLVTLRARRGEIYYTLDGTDPRSPGGAVSAKATLYKSAVVLAPGDRLFARAFSNKSWTSPAADCPLQRP